ncbi:MAG TPA: alpha-1,2-fucosyltransferase [Sedimentibacter sp.]|nr:alpha-1,2-fucosyltransferase [Sedimentibacter sp.]
MIIVKIWGGVGNQLFQYALYRKLLHQGKDAKVDLSWFNIKKRNQQRTYKLDLFQTDIRECTRREKKKLANGTDNRRQRIIQKVIGKRKSHVYEKKAYTFDASILERDNVYLEGYWQTQLYFADIKEILQKEIIMEHNKSIYFNETLKRIMVTNSISVHIRRSDYLLKAEKYGNICTKEYYNNALNYMERKIQNPVFYIFTDDMVWAKDTYKDRKDIVFIDGNGKAEENDFILMSKCKHNIIANSSFSWWAAWLNGNADKIVIAPDKWINEVDTPDIWCENWVHI